MVGCVCFCKCVCVCVCVCLCVCVCVCVCVCQNSVSNFDTGIKCEIMVIARLHKDFNLCSATILFFV